VSDADAAETERPTTIGDCRRIGGRTGRVTSAEDERIVCERRAAAQQEPLW